jgi:hypothetical protein
LAAIAIKFYRQGMSEKTRYASRILETVRESATDLFAGGAIDAVQMKKFDELCLPAATLPKKNLI